MVSPSVSVGTRYKAYDALSSMLYLSVPHTLLSVLSIEPQPWFPVCRGLCLVFRIILLTIPKQLHAGNIEVSLDWKLVTHHNAEVLGKQRRVHIW